MSKNDIAWQQFLEQTSFLDEIKSTGYCYVTADDLKRFGKREPRLMAKLDTLSVRPRIFKQHDLTIFPVQNGRYIIFCDPDQKSYYDLSAEQDDLTVETYRSRVDLTAFDSYWVAGNFSESQAIDFAFLSSLLKTFTDDEDLHLVIRGRLYSGDFGFSLPGSSHRVEVSGVQIEVDVGYESPNGIYLFEAKVGRRSDFHIRQLYYPYLEWSRLSHKRVVPIFLTYTNGQYVLTEFAFNEDFGDLTARRTQGYVIDESPTVTIDLEDALQRAPMKEESTPYPQANDLDKVVDLVTVVDDEVNSKHKVAEFFEFDERQGDYYANAACYLGLLERNDHRFELTDLGRNFVRTRSRTDRIRLLSRILLRYPTFRVVFQLLLEKGLDLEQVATDEIAQIIERYTELTGSTPRRRASTVRSWLGWILKNCEVR